MADAISERALSGDDKHRGPGQRMLQRVLVPESGFKTYPQVPRFFRHLQRDRLLNIDHILLQQLSVVEIEDFPQAITDYKDQFTWKKAAETDWGMILADPEKWNEDHRVCTAEDCGNSHQNGDPNYCVAAQVLRRCNGLESVCAGNEALVGPSSQGDHRALLWKFYKEVLLPGKQLGSGPFGSVSLATWLRDKYAHKLFKYRGLDSLPNYASAVYRMIHPHIIQVLAYSEDSVFAAKTASELFKCSSFSGTQVLGRRSKEKAWI